MITTTEEVNKWLRQLVAGVAQVEEAIGALNGILDAVIKGEKKITKELYQVVEAAQIEAMKGGG